MRSVFCGRPIHWELNHPDTYKQWKKLLELVLEQIFRLCSKRLIQFVGEAIEAFDVCRD